MLRIRLLGRFEAREDDGDLPGLRGPRRQALLAYLLLHGGAPCSRRRVAYLFWADSSDGQARTNLRQLLHYVRNALPQPDRFLDTDDDRILWRPDAPATVDVHEVEEARLAAEEARARGEAAAERVALERAADLYRGDLLPECYERWIEPHRDRLRARALETGTRLARLLEAARDYEEALRRLQALQALDPLREETCRNLMRLHALTGEPARGMAVFRDFEELLGRELDMEPSEATRELAQRLTLRDGPVRPGTAEPDRSPSSHGPFVGRHDEWRTLLDEWEAAEENPRLVLVSGEAGIGKTRLAEEFLEWADRQGIGTARARCYAGEGSLPYDPVVQWLRSPTIRPGLRRLEDVWSRELSRLLPELGKRRPGRVPGGRGDESWQRARLFEALRRAAVPSSDPLILLLDDLQWCDRDTLDWLHYLLRSDVSARLVVLATLRSGEIEAGSAAVPWLLEVAQRGSLKEIPLEPLSREDTRELGEAVRGGELPDEEADRLFDDTEGNPLFVLETLRAFSPPEGNDPAGSAFRSAGGRSLPIPVRVRSVIASRVERLSPPARRLLELAAAVGREFNLDVLRRSTPKDESGLVDALDELCRRHLVRDHGDRTYDFAHHRIREVAYAGVSTARRAYLHRRIAEALESAEGPGGSAAREIAGHFEAAGLPERAIPHLRAAAENAVLVYASDEAVAALSRALDLLRELPPSRTRDERELELRMALGPPLVALEFYSGSRVWENYERARELSHRLARPPEPPILRGLALAHLMGSRLERTLELAEDLRTAAERSGDRMLQMEAHYVLGVARHWRGEFARSRTHLERACSLYAPDRTRSHLRLYSQDPGVVCRVRLGLTLWHLGQEDRAHRMVLEAITRAEELGHPFTLAYARYFAGWVLLECGDLDELARQADAQVHDSSDQSLRVWPIAGEFLRGWVEIRRDGDRGGLERMLGAADGLEEHGMNLGLPFLQGLVAEGWGMVGSHRVGLGHVDMALAMSRETGERFWDAELHRIRGALLAELGEESEAATSFRRAAEIAADQACVPLLERARMHLRRGRDGASGA